MTKPKKIPGWRPPRRRTGEWNAHLLYPNDMEQPRHDEVMEGWLREQGVKMPEGEE